MGPRWRMARAAAPAARHIQAGNSAVTLAWRWPYFKLGSGVEKRIKPKWRTARAAATAARHIRAGNSAVALACRWPFFELEEWSRLSLFLKCIEYCLSDAVRGLCVQTGATSAEFEFLYLQTVELGQAVCIVP
jgi:hypothetical protein